MVADIGDIRADFFELFVMPNVPNIMIGHILKKVGRNTVEVIFIKQILFPQLFLVSFRQILHIRKQVRNANANGVNNAYDNQYEQAVDNPLLGKNIFQ